MQWTRKNQKAGGEENENSERPAIHQNPLAFTIDEPTCFCSRCGMFARCCYPSANQDRDQKEGGAKNASFLELKGKSAADYGTQRKGKPYSRKDVYFYVTSHHGI